jgi:hypothetical protein
MDPRNDALDGTIHSMAGYSGTPLPQKLGIKEGHRVVLVDAPGDFDLGILPMGAVLQRGLAQRGTPPPPLDVIVAFVKQRAELVTRLEACRPRMAQDGGLWIAWPKKASGVATDIVEGTIREVALPTGLVDNKVCAIDDIWSGLRLVIRKELRTPAAPATARAQKRPAAAAQKRPAAATAPARTRKR